MKPLLPLRSTLLAGFLSLATAGAVFAQSPSPSATTIPASKPATETATPSPGAPVNTSTPAEKSDSATGKDGGRSMTDKDRAARKAERLQKYDKNHDGKLDESEKAAMRADRANAKKAGADKEKASPTP